MMWHIYEDTVVTIYMLFGDMDGDKQLIQFSMNKSSRGTLSCSVGGYILRGQKNVSEFKLTDGYKQSIISTMFEKGVEMSKDE